MSDPNQEQLASTDTTETPPEALENSDLFDEGAVDEDDPDLIEIELPSQQLAANSPIVLLVNITLPDGYRINTAAASGHHLETLGPIRPLHGRLMKPEFTPEGEWPIGLETVEGSGGTSLAGIEYTCTFHYGKDASDDQMHTIRWLVPLRLTKFSTKTELVLTAKLEK